MKELKFNIKMYSLLLKMTMRGILQYRADFWMSLVSVVLLNGANIVQLSVISWRFNAIGNWRVGDLLVLYGMFMISWSIFSVFFRKLSKIEEEIVSGSFDVYLLRPVSIFLQLVGGDINYTGLCDTVMGIALVITGLTVTETVWGWWHIGWFIVFVLSGGTIVVCLRFLISCVTFWTTKASALSSIFTQIYLLTQKYPLTIFGRAFRILATGLVPVAYLNFYPAAYLLEKPDVPPWLCVLSPLAALVWVGIAVLVWGRALRRYNSSGG
ncbi:MAG: ABC-2 family transporter protein [Clostridiales bacterium]|nr:ABC-2 family transporter protein [Clostridiales bacterium]